MYDYLFIEREKKAFTQGYFRNYRIQTNNKNFSVQQKKRTKKVSVERETTTLYPFSPISKCYCSLLKLSKKNLHKSMTCNPSYYLQKPTSFIL